MNKGLLGTCSNTTKHVGGVIVIVLAPPPPPPPPPPPSAVVRGFEPQSCQTKHHQIVICCLTAE